MKTRIVVKDVSGVAIWVGVGWTLLKFAWRIIGHWQEADQFIEELPAFIRWFDRPFSGLIVMALGLLVYGALLLYDARVKEPETVTFGPAAPAPLTLVGKFFHTFSPGADTWQYQGQVLREGANDQLFVQLYDVIVGAPSTQQYLTEEQKRSARFYDTEGEWRDEGERMNRRAGGRR